jgi:hypothetical protein
VQLKLCRATREKLRSQRRERRQQQRRERYSQLDYRLESCDTSRNGSDDTAFWPRSGYSHQQPEAEYLDDVNRSAPQSDAADSGTQVNAEEPDTEPEELSSGSLRYYLCPRAKINYKGM